MMEPRVKELLNKAKEGTLTFSRAAGKTVNKVANQAKQNMRVFQLNTDVDIAYKEIGRLVYAIHAGEDVCSEAVQAQLETIDSKKAQIAAIKAEQAEAKAERAAKKAEEKTDEEACEEVCKKIEEKVEECVCECKEAVEEVAEEAADEVCTCACEEKAEPCCCEEKPEA